MVEDMGEIVGDSGTGKESGSSSKKHSGGTNKSTKSTKSKKTKEAVKEKEKESKKKKRGRPKQEPGTVPVKKDRGENPLLTTTEASEICGLSTNIVRNWLKTGKLQGVALPTGVRVHQRVYKKDLLAFMEKCGLHIPNQETDNGTV